MTDARYLVHERHLPLIPAGACCLGWRGDVRLDLSAPPTINGTPTRLDPLPWALAVLGRRLGVRISSADDIRPMSWGTDATAWQVLDGARYVPVLPPEIDGPEPYDPRDPNQIRRVVAEALKRTHVQTESP